MTALLLLAALHADGAFFRDDQGAAVILRGFNVAGDAKVPPFQPIQDPALLDPLERWGANVIRLLFNWEAFEPQPDAFDQSYLDYYRGVVQAAGERGIYVIVDFHQDGYSRFSIGGCGEGFPAWALPPTVTPATPDNGPACADWGKRIIGTPDLDATWNAFYADSYGARSHFLNMISRVGQALADEPAVIGYDLLNEPGGDEPTQIGPLYEDAARTLRAVDVDAMMFVSPTVITSSGKQTFLPRPGFANFAYSPHYYDPVIALAHSWSGSDESSGMELMTAKAREWDVPLLIGEWGAPPSTDEVHGYLDATTRQMDLALASNTQWVYTPGWTPDKKDGWNVEDFSVVDDHGAERANHEVHPFPRRVAGTPLAFTVEKELLDLFWQNDPAAGETELFVPAGYFGKLSFSEITADPGVTCTRDGDLIHCSAAGEGVKHVRVFVAPDCGLTGAEGLLLLVMCTRLRRRSSRSGRPCSTPRS